MSTQFTNRQWRLPNNENKDKQSNYSMDFDTSSTHIEFSTIQLNTTKSVSLWVNFDSTIFGVPLGGGLNNYYPAIQISGSNTLFYLRDSTGFDFVTYNNLLNANQWYHICITGNGTTATFYLNGSLIGTLTDKTPPLKYINTENGSLYGIVGKLDAVSIFNYELSSSQVTTLYGSSSTGIGNPMSLSPAPVAYYPLGDQDSFNGADYLVPNSSLKDYVFDFDGSNDYIGVGTGLGNTLGSSVSDMTVSLWYKNQTGSNEGLFTIMSSITAGTTNPFAISYNTNSIYVWFGSNYNYYSQTLDSNWHHLSIVKNGTSLTTYIDGSSVSPTATVGSIPATIDTTNKETFIGVYYNASFTYNGSLSNAQVFNTALPATGSNSVETLYNNGSPLTSMSGFTSLQGWWKLDASATYDGTDWTVPDDSTNSNDGTSSGMTQSALQQSDLSFKTSISPFAFNFDGTSDQINSGSNLGISGASPRTFSAWMKTTDAGGGYDVIVATGNTGNGGNNFELDFRNNVIMWERWGLGIMGSVVVNDGNWHHACITYDGNILKLYVDGSEDTGGDFPYTIGATTSTDTPVRIGGMNHSAKYFNGSISNVSVWNAALTSAQVTEIYSEGIPQNLLNHSAVSSLVSWWQLGSNSSFNTNWTVLDEKGSNNGTSVNMTEASIVDGVGSYANGLSSGMGGDEVIGDAPYSSSNSLSVNMDVEDRTTDTPS